jgi:hypothetical protein
MFKVRKCANSKMFKFEIVEIQNLCKFENRSIFEICLNSKIVLFQNLFKFEKSFNFQNLFKFQNRSISKFVQIWKIVQFFKFVHIWKSFNSNFVQIQKIVQFLKFVQILKMFNSNFVQIWNSSDLKQRKNEKGKKKKKLGPAQHIWPRWSVQPNPQRTSLSESWADPTKTWGVVGGWSV